jgi:DNA-binding NarL/FixJ family response regulator
MPIRIALVDDNATFRTRCAQRLQFFDAVNLVHTAPNGRRFLDALDALPRAGHPQVVLMDVEMPGLQGPAVTRRLLAKWPAIDVLMLTVFESDDVIFEAIRSGASGYLLKETSAAGIVEAIETLVQGGAPMSPAIARRMLHFVRKQPAPAADDARAGERLSLTPRQTEVLHHLVEGATEEAIAYALSISPHTVRTHIKNMYKRLHVHSRASLVRVAFEHRLLDNDPNA